MSRPCSNELVYTYVNLQLFSAHCRTLFCFPVSFHILPICLILKNDPKKKNQITNNNKKYNSNTKCRTQNKNLFQKQWASVFASYLLSSPVAAYFEILNWLDYFAHNCESIHWQWRQWQERRKSLTINDEILFVENIYRETIIIIIGAKFTLHSTPSEDWRSISVQYLT